MNDVMASIAGLTPAEKFELLGSLWDDLSATPDEIPIPDWQKQELDRRRGDMRETTWDDIVNRLKAKYGH
jgi:putative addiction module component (TIGR02574 family)